MKQGLQQLAIVYLKGLAMGAADVVPGVSGGTIALITHIYERLIRAIDTISVALILQLFTAKRKEAWAKVDGNFLLALFLGIITSILLLSGAITWLLKNHPIPLWAFFFGLISGSALILKKSISKWHLTTALAGILGIVTAFGVGLISPSAASENLLYLFFCGMLVVIAMILPGISGAFILILLGAYTTALETVEQLKNLVFEGVIVFLVMASGGLVGLKLFSKLLRWLFTHHKNTILAAMTGFLVGSLYKVWPWKNIIEYYTNSNGEKTALKTIAVIPSFSDASDQVILALIAFLFGGLLLFVLERFSKPQKK